ncbi:MAG: N-acetylmuramoyl-L-alanine amidase [Lachnospiraceae bacterium]|nr:N-acetylmuramoyl-L-alanine amidase [Lachnospiraceae bacterium]
MSFSKVRVFISMVLCIVLFTLIPCENVIAADRVFPHDDNLVIVIDPGHGGTDTGTQGGRIQERFMNLITAQALASRLSMYEGVTVYMTRSDNDTTMSLTDRAKYAQSVDADFVFSIHYNACYAHDRFGIEVYTSRVAPYNAYGYQFGNLLMQKFESRYGIFPRGVKTRKGLRTEGDYYTIISANIYREIPAVIIEHCFADGTVDAVHTASDDQFRSYGETDADAIAEYFGLKSSILGIDFTGASDNLISADPANFNDATYEDRTAPDSVNVSVVSVDPTTNTITVRIEATEADGMMMFYTLSTDGGWTWEESEVWPGADTYNGTFDSSFELTLSFEAGDRPDIVIKGFNRYDAYTKSNQITFIDRFNSQDSPLYREA